MILGVASVSCAVALSPAECTPNEQLRLCRDELRAIADTIEFSTLENPTWAHLFRVDGRDVSDDLRTIADRLEERFADCPCIGTCTVLEACAAKAETD